MSKNKHLKISKLLSYILRHKPDEFGIKLTIDGYVNLSDLVEAINKSNNLNFSLSEDDVKQVVKDCDKQRYSLSNDGLMIRASQGHSVEVDLKYSPCKPPDYLYHGTSTITLVHILRDGLLKMERHHVHLSDNIDTASKVGKRHGELVLLKVYSSEMYSNGIVFYKSDNGVWLVDNVGVEYLEVIG